MEESCSGKASYRVVEESDTLGEECREGEPVVEESGTLGGECREEEREVEEMGTCKAS